MKTIDQTPFYSEKSELSFMDRTKATLKYGKLWVAEMEAQKSVLPVLEKNLDKSYTLLRNVNLPGLDTAIPFILVGPSGIYTIYVTPLKGMFRAKGDQWGTISSNTFKPEKPNLLTRTERMARAVQVYLQRGGYSDLNGVEAVLLCADSGVHVDSLRPIVRIVMRDALERFAVSIMQSRVVLSPEAVYDVINRILYPPEPKEETPAPETGDTQLASQPETDSGGEALASTFAASAGEPAPAQWGEAVPGAWSEDPPASLVESPTQPTAVPTEQTDQPRPRNGKKFSRKQVLFLAGMLIIWCLMVAVFIFLVVKDLPL